MKKEKRIIVLGCIGLELNTCTSTLKEKGVLLPPKATDPFAPEPLLIINSHRSVFEKYATENNNIFDKPKSKYHR